MAGDYRSGGKIHSKRTGKTKVPQTRGMGEIQRSESGGAVKGRIPKAGGTNAMNFETGVGASVQPMMKKFKSKAKKVKDKTSTKGN